MRFSCWCNSSTANTVQQSAWKKNYSLFFKQKPQRSNKEYHVSSVSNRHSVSGVYYLSLLHEKNSWVVFIILLLQFNIFGKSVVGVICSFVFSFFPLGIFKAKWWWELTRSMGQLWLTNRQGCTKAWRSSIGADCPLKNLYIYCHCETDELCLHQWLDNRAVRQTGALIWICSISWKKLSSFTVWVRKSGLHCLDIIITLCVASTGVELGSP